MINILKKLFVATFLLSLVALPAIAALVVKTELVSGKIAQLYLDHSLKLDNGFIYKPSRKGLQVNLQKGDLVTLRYYVESSGNKIFFEYAPGQGSLNPLPPYAPNPSDLRPK